jgi:hypothetical protein
MDFMIQNNNIIDLDFFGFYAKYMIIGAVIWLHADTFYLVYIEQRV